MKMTVRCLLCVLCAAMIIAIPFVIPSPDMLDEVKWNILDEIEEAEEDYEEEENDLLSFLFPAAYAEDVLIEEEVITEAEGEKAPLTEGVYTLPMDDTLPPAPNPACFTEDGYEDETIRVHIEHFERDESRYHTVWIEIADASQFRTAVSGRNNAKVTTMAEKNNAVIAMNGDYYKDNESAKTFEYRMGKKYNKGKGNKLRDTLIIDEKGDFHIFTAGSKPENFEGTIVNAFTFGPVLVNEGETVPIPKDYKYSPNGHEARSAIGQTGHLKYVFVVVERKAGSKGVTMAQLGEYMKELGCITAYNLDGGNTAQIVINGQEYFGDTTADARSQSDIIYFATAVPEEAREE